MIGFNHITQKGAEYLSNGDLKGLKILGLADNEISDKGVEFLS